MLQKEVIHMGLLDPKLDKKRAFLLLARKGAIKAVLEFEGGHDEGYVQGITLTLRDGTEVDLPTWYCGGYTLGDKDPITGHYAYVPLNTPANEDEELADLLEGPINATFGAWGGVESTNGTLTWDCVTRQARMSYTQEETSWSEYEEVI